MPLFVLIGIDKPAALPVRLANREAHLAFVQARLGVLRLAGPFLDEADGPIGSMLVIEVENLAEAQAFQANDPYAVAGLFERTELRPWRLTVGALG